MKRVLLAVLILVFLLTIGLQAYAEGCEPIAKKEFLASFDTLLSQYGYSKIDENSKGNLTRSEMATIVGKVLIDEKIIDFKESTLPFKDISTLKEEEKMYIGVLYKNNILKGRNKNIFDPKGQLTREESKIVLERLKGVLENMKRESIPFKVKNLDQAYSGVVEGLIVDENDKYYEVNIVECFPTPGYSIGVDNVVVQNDRDVIIYLNIVPPKEGSILPQVVTYKTMTLELDKSYLKEGSYTFSTKYNSFARGMRRELY